MCKTARSYFRCSKIKPEVKETYIADFKSGSLLDHSALLADIEFSKTESCHKIISFGDLKILIQRQ